MSGHNCNCRLSRSDGTHWLHCKEGERRAVPAEKDGEPHDLDTDALKQECYPEEYGESGIVERRLYASEDWQEMAALMLTDRPEPSYPSHRGAPGREIARVTPVTVTAGHGDHIRALEAERDAAFVQLRKLDAENERLKREYNDLYATLSEIETEGKLSRAELKAENGRQVERDKLAQIKLSGISSDWKGACVRAEEELATLKQAVAEIRPWMPGFLRATDWKNLDGIRIAKLKLVATAIGAILETNSTNGDNK